MSPKRKRKKTPPSGEPSSPGVLKETGNRRARFFALLGMLAILAAAVAFFVLQERTPDGNFLLITLDTTRSDRLGCYGYEEIATPEIDSLAAQGFLFENAVASVPITVPSHATLLTGLYPSTHGIHNNTQYVLSGDAVTLAEVMRENGYKTGAVIGAFVLDSKYGLDQGFDFYDDELPEPPAQHVNGPEKGERNIVALGKVAERPASLVTQSALAWLRENSDQRFFLWVHYYDPHFPYEPPLGFSQKYDGRPYDGEIATVDWNLGRLLEELERGGLLDRTLIVVAGDHGESLGEHGEETHSVFVYEPTIRVPLIMRYPSKLPGGSKVSALVSLADVMPTVLDLLGIEYASSFDGMSLADLVSTNAAGERAVYLESLFPYLTYGWSELRGVRTSHYKYIRLPTPELYDLREDPLERKNLAEEREDIVSQLEGELEKLASQDSPQSLAEEATLSALDRERLTALGYLSGGVPERGNASLRDPKEMISYHELMVLGQQAIQAGNYPEAQDYIQRVVKGDPKNAYARSALGMILYHNGDLAGAKKELEMAIELNPENVSGDHCNLGIVLTALGRDEEAVASFERALEIDPFRADYCIALARAYLKMGQAEKAQALYRRAMELEERRKP